MSKKNIVAFIGARPQIIKHSAIERAVKDHFLDRINLITIHSGQHYSAEMSDIFFEEMGIDPPHLNLNVGSSSHALQTAIMMEKLDHYLEQNPCDAFLVYGDTNSTLAGALVASKRHIPVVHIEAGLRSFDKMMPEEINRIMTDHVSSLLFCPTKAAIHNLKNESVVHHEVGRINQPAVFYCGDIMYDNSLYFSNVSRGKTNFTDQLHLIDNQYILATVHRESNTEDPKKLASIFRAFLRITKETELKIVLPLHPRTKKAIKLLPNEIIQNLEKDSSIQIIEPVGFLEMIALEKYAKMIVTDSGGVQKEAYFFQKPAIILRPNTEWVEIVQNGCAQTVDTDIDKIIQAVHYYLTKGNLQFPAVFGDGNAAQFILSKIYSLC